MRPILLTLAVLLLPLADAARGQMVRTYPGGGVSVRAPFVRVNVGPNGQTSVRAPFVNLTTPGRPPCCPTPPGESQPLMPAPAPALADKMQPTPANPATLDWQALRRMLRSGVAMLNDQLDDLETGVGWKEYLQTGPLAGLVADDVDQPPDSAALDTMRASLERYDATSVASEFQMVAELRGFRTVHAALREFVARPVSPGRQRPMEAVPAPSPEPHEF